MSPILRRRRPRARSRSRSRARPEEADAIFPPAFTSSLSLALALALALARARARGRHKKAGVPWTPEEHKRFLLGLSALGKGDWRGISRHYVQTRTPTQVASHAQKYFIRQTSTGNKRKRRTSLFDTTLDSVCAGDHHHQQQQHNANNNGSHSGSLATEREDAQQPSVSPNSVSAQDHQQTGSLPLGIVPVGILAGDHHHDHDQLQGGVPGMMAQQIAGMGALAGAMAGGAGLFVPPGFGMFPALDPGTLMMLMSSMMGQQQHQQRMSPQVVPGAVPPQIFRPMAVRYTSTEVQKFKSAHGNGAANGNGANGASGANTEAKGADKQDAKGKVAIAAKPNDPSSQSLSNGNSSSSQTTLELAAT